MNEPRRAFFRELKQILWALFLVYLLLAVFGFLFGRQIGFEDAFLVCLSIAILVTVSFFTVFLFAFLWSWLDRRTGRRH